MADWEIRCSSMLPWWVLPNNVDLILESLTTRGNIFDRKSGPNIITEYHQLQHCFEMLHCGDRYGLIDGDEVDLHESHEFCEELFNECPNHVSLNGYFQTEKYFKNAEKLIRLDFRFKKHIIKEVESHFKQYLDQKPVCILVRDFNPEFDYPNCENNHINVSLTFL